MNKKEFRLLFLLSELFYYSPLSSLSSSSVENKALFFDFFQTTGLDPAPLKNPLLDS